MSAPWRFIALLALVAFTLQSFIIQTHIHGVSRNFDGTAIVKILASSPAHGKVPVDNSPLDCPFCQAIAHTGAFFTPAAPILILPSVWTECAAPSFLLCTVARAAARSWQSRAPPQA